MLFAQHFAVFIFLNLWIMSFQAVTHRTWKPIFRPQGVLIIAPDMMFHAPAGRPNAPQNPLGSSVGEAEKTVCQAMHPEPMQRYSLDSPNGLRFTATVGAKPVRVALKSSPFLLWRAISSRCSTRTSGHHLVFACPSVTTSLIRFLLFQPLWPIG